MNGSNNFNDYFAGGNYSCAKELQDSLKEFVRDLTPNLFATLVFNRQMLPVSARKTLKHFYSNIERRCLGKRFYNAAPAERLIAVAFPEHMTSNFHYHVVAHLPRRQLPTFQVYANSTWRKLCESGSIVLRMLDADSDRSSVTSYCCKEVFKAQNYENFILSTEFWNS
jgi:hypothetical protein